jgi:hypothetical protein
MVVGSAVDSLRCVVSIGFDSFMILILGLDPRRGAEGTRLAPTHLAFARNYYVVSLLEILETRRTVTSLANSTLPPQKKVKPKQLKKNERHGRQSISTQ